MSTLLEILAAELERPRGLSSRVTNYIGRTYGVDREAVGLFLVDELPKLEDYELDLILSPVFTPKLADQAVFAAMLGRDSIPREEWPALIQRLVRRPTVARLIAEDGRAHSVPLREVTLERYVHRLRLDASIPESLFVLIDRTSPADRPLLCAIARSACWEKEAARDILVRYLSNSVDRSLFLLDDAVELLNLMESSKPADLNQLMALIPRRQDALREQIDTASAPKPFFSNRVQAMHGENDQRGRDDARIIAKQTEFDFLARLQQILTD